MNARSTRSAPVHVGSLAAEVIERTIQVSRIPAPTGEEQERAALVADWWASDGFGSVSVDKAGNCWAKVSDGSGPATVLAAHLDTVFDAETDHSVKRSGDRLCGPGVGDNGVAIAALAAVGRLLGISELSSPVFILATVGEEGLGNLTGARHAVASPPAELGALIAIEGNYLGKLGTTGVGSRRWRVVVTGPGGHAWEQSRAPSAVHEAARIVDALSRIKTVAGTSSLNIGRLDGGESINARARRAHFDIDLRGADEDTLAALDKDARRVLEAPPANGLSVELSEIGRRPGGSIKAGHPLVRAAREALDARGVAWREVATSTDANAGHAVGLPALALGVTTGEGEHTPEEWIDLGPIADGIAVLADTVVRYEKTRGTEQGSDR